ncbi:hypothetical protein A8L34_27385 [Bacillus sp. FJAT-27264]|uniref:DUF896 domain-containing protein n=1 Tax=Paenibacillus sp. (strain DSM 101736 / FJAT-27264) TaxID=1850362 RepID=UPI000807D885|nr:DUF896 domain-containing protein [Bacillus sp. FJAT-27264]OBZ16158.1 hypothetical protein A8L34_27385 [Bacillus sp. FJAT-27264]
MEMDILINRINELSRKSKARGLNEQEIVERDSLRKQYLAIFKSNFRQELNRIEFVDDNSLKH